MKDFVPYKESLELEKLGLEFVEGSPCLGYHNMVNHSGEYKFDYRIWEVTDNYIEAPLFSQAFRFFRDKHNLSGIVSQFGYGIENQFGQVVHVISEDENPLSYEDSELGCLRKLIEIVKNGNE